MYLTEFKFQDGFNGFGFVAHHISVSAYINCTVGLTTTFDIVTNLYMSNTVCFVKFDLLRVFMITSDKFIFSSIKNPIGAYKCRLDIEINSLSTSGNQRKFIIKNPTY